MATTRKFKSAKNNQAINAFLDIVAGSVRVGSLNAMQKIAARGIETLTRHVATFGDYTGEMINSYQAAVLTNGKLVKEGKYLHEGAFTARGQVRGETAYEHVFKGPKGDIRVITSYGTTKNAISYKSADRKGRSVALRNDPYRRVNPEVKQSIRMPRGRHYQGFGRDLTGLKTRTPSVQTGIEVVFSNPTPYAKTVMERNRGSHVMPIGGAMEIVGRNAFVSITGAEIRKVVQRAKRKK